MSDFDKIICPMLVPSKCNLPEKEREKLLPDLKYRIFFMLDYKRQKKDILIETIKNYFPHPYFLMEARNIAGHREKICKICKIALACTCGIASLTPLNNNVFLEVGMLMALGKPILYLFDMTYGQKPEELPFDVSTKMLIPYKNKDELIKGLDREIDLFKEMIKPSETLYDSESKIKLKEKINSLNKTQLEFIKILLFERGRLIPDEICKKYKIAPDDITKKLEEFNIVIKSIEHFISLKEPKGNFQTWEYNINPEIKEDLIKFYNEGLIS